MDHLKEEKGNGRMGPPEAKWDHQEGGKCQELIIKLKEPWEVPLQCGPATFSLPDGIVSWWGMGSERFSPAPAKVPPGWGGYPLRRASFSPNFLTLGLSGSSDSLSTVQQGAWPGLPFLELRTFIQF